jgi:hypothetical protein
MLDVDSAVNAIPPEEESSLLWVYVLSQRRRGVSFGLTSSWVEFGTGRFS